jgi:hypothetical protein
MGVSQVFWYLQGLLAAGKLCIHVCWKEASMCPCCLGLSLTTDQLGRLPGPDPGSQRGSSCGAVMAAW